MNHLDKVEVLELIEFDDSQGHIKVSKIIATFFEKHFNSSLSSEEQDAIIKRLSSTKF